MNGQPTADPVALVKAERRPGESVKACKERLVSEGRLVFAAPPPELVIGADEECAGRIEAAALLAVYTVLGDRAKGLPMADAEILARPLMPVLENIEREKD